MTRNRSLILTALLVGGVWLLPSKASDRGVPITVSTATGLTVEVPQEAIDKSVQVLKGPPSSWLARNYQSPLLNGHILWLYDHGQEHFVSFLIKPEHWIRLNSMESLPRIGQVFSYTKSDLEAKHLFGSFMHDLSCIYRGYGGLALTSEYRASRDAADEKNERLHQLAKPLGAAKPKGLFADADIAASSSAWRMDYPSADLVAKVRSLCGEEVQVTDKNFSIEVNMLSSRNFVEHWNVSGIFFPDGKLNICNIAITPISTGIKIFNPDFGDF